MNTTEIKVTEMTKADKVEQAYYAAVLDYNISSEGCYSLAVEAAHELGGVEIYNSNNVHSNKSCTPTLEFAFYDLSSVKITREGAFVIELYETYQTA